MNIPEISAAEAAAFINHGEWIGVGGFGPAGAPKTIPPAIAAKARASVERMILGVPCSLPLSVVTTPIW